MLAPNQSFLCNSFRYLIAFSLLESVTNSSYLTRVRQWTFSRSPVPAFQYTLSAFLIIDTRQPVIK